MAADTDIEFLVKASYLEIYMEKIKDLLDPVKNNLKVREEKSKGIWVEGATEVYVSSEQEVLEVIRAGTQNRVIAATQMNAESSRSHSLFILNVLQRNLKDGSQKSGKLYLVDLAGSEKVEKTGATGTTLDEAKTINKSLSALGNVINALTDGKSSHVPYRDSKLTRILQESLGGNSRTTLIINCSPSSYNEAETLSTIRFGYRAKSIKNKAKVNQERSVTELKNLLLKSEQEISSLQSTVAALQEEIQALKGFGGSTPMSSDALASLPNVVKLQDKITSLEDQLKKLEEEKQQLAEINEELKDKETDSEQVATLKDELNMLKNSEQNLAQENELLIVKLADITIDNEKLQYDNNEAQLTVQSLQGENASLKSEVTSLYTKVDQLTEERNKATKMQSLLSFQKDQSDWNEKEELEPESQNDELETSTQENDEVQRDRTQSHSGFQDTTNLEGVRQELENQRKEIEQLRREKQTLQFQLENAASLPGTPQEGQPKENQEEGTKDVKQLEKELHLLREQTNQKLGEFDTLKAALFKDLENRCQKVIELEMLLDEAREQYQALLVQVKNSNSKALQQKCIFLQRNLEQLTTVQQQLVNENNKLKLDNQVYAKQLAIRNERIHGLELLLQDAQDKLVKYASSDPSGRNVKKPGQVALPIGSRMIKPIRGGGGGAGPPTTMTTPSGSKVTISASSIRTESPDRRDKRSTSIWDLFSRSKPTDASPEQPSPESPAKQ